MTTKEAKLEKIVAALQKDASLADSFLEMIETVEDKKCQLKTGDDAEEAVVTVIQKAGATMLQKWLRKKGEEAESSASFDRALRLHQKKRFAGILPWETSN